MDAENEADFERMLVEEYVCLTEESSQEPLAAEAEFQTTENIGSDVIPEQSRAPVVRPQSPSPASFSASPATGFFSPAHASADHGLSEAPARQRLRGQQKVPVFSLFLL